MMKCCSFKKRQSIFGIKLIQSTEYMIRFYRHFVACLFIALLAGCTFVRYEYQAPVSEAGLQCVAQCANLREMCSANESYRAQNEAYACEQRNRWNYQQCLRRARNKDEARGCGLGQPMCWANANTYRCDEYYRSCFVGCGGRVDVIKEK